MATKEEQAREDGAVDQEFCCEHQERIAEMFCIKCETGVCSLCLCHGKGQHVGHVVTTLEEWGSRMKKQAKEVEDNTEELAKTVEDIICDVTQCGQDVEKLHNEYGNKIKKDYERVMKVVECWGNRTVQAMALEAASIPYPPDLHVKQQRIRRLFDTAQTIGFPCSLQEIATGRANLTEVKTNLNECKTQVDEMKEQNESTKRSVDDLENTFKTRVHLFNEEANDCISAINSIIVT